ncbi:MAG: ABC transporter substrate-binding protein [Deltaproteobacteria bacterium]|nr:ABC transporter substrate-binding protein [Deltaproteobacteria bacterium]
MRKKSLLNRRVNRRGFLEASGKIGLGAAALTFGVPKLLRAAPAPVKIGSVQPVTGPLSVIGQGQRKAQILAVETINAAGGVKSMGGAKLELLLGDSESKPEVARSEADRLMNAGAAMIVGPFDSGAAMAIATLAEQRQVPFLMDVAALDDITQKGYQYSFRIFPTGATFGRTGVAYIRQILDEKKLSPKSAVLTHTGDAFGKGQAEHFRKAFEAAGLSVKIVDQISYPVGIPDLSAEVAKIKAAKPDLLFPICRPGDSVILTRELFKQRVELLGIISPGSPGWYEPKAVADLDKLIYYVMDNVPWVNPKSPTFQSVNQAFEKKYGQYIDTNSGYAYTGILVAADVLERAASVKPDRLVKALRETNFKDHPMVGEAVQFAKNGDNLNAATAIVQVLPDPNVLHRVKVVLPKKFAQADYVFPAPQLWERK